MRRLLRAMVLLILLGCGLEARATQITVAQYQRSGWQSPVTNPVLRISLNKPVVTSDSKFLPSGSIDNGPWYLTVQCSVSGGVLTIPQFTIDSLTDALTNPDASYAAGLYRVTGNQKIEVFSGFTKFSVPSAPTTTTWSALQVFNATFVPFIDQLTYSRTQINGLIAAAVGGLPDPGMNGLLIRTALNTTASRSLVSSSSPNLAITNPDGVGGNPTFALGTNVPILSGGKIPTSEIQGVIGLTDLTDVTAKKGNSTTVQLQSGATVTNDCAKFDASGNLVSAGAPCGAGGMAIGGTVTGGTAGSIPFVATGPILAQDNVNLFWNNSLKLLISPLADKGGQEFNVRATGAVCDYNPATNVGTDDTTAIQNLINSVPEGATILVPDLANCKLTAQLTINKALTLKGAGIHALYGSADDDLVQLAPYYVPTKAPYLLGSIFTQTTAATNILEVTAQGRAVNIQNLGFKFANNIAFKNTGHAVHSLAPNMSDGTPDQGLVSARIDENKVFGVDGNHYAFTLTNPSLLLFMHNEGWGGGGLELFANTNLGIFGNITAIESYFAVVAGGTSHGYFIHKSGATPGINLSTFIRPQSNVTQPPAIYTVPFPGIAALQAGQKIWINSSTPYLTIIQPDWETNAGAGITLETTGPGFFMTSGFVDAAGATVGAGDFYSQYFSTKSDGIRVLTGGNTAVDILQAGGNSFFDHQGILSIRNNVGVNHAQMLADGSLALKGAHSPDTALDVNGPISLRDGGTKNRNGGLVSEANAGLIEYGINDGSANRFGGTYTQADQGGFLRFDTRAGFNLIGFYGRPAGTANPSGTELVTVLSGGNVGIGQTSPASLLDVGGTVNVGSSATINGALYPVLPRITAGAGTGITVNNAGEVRQIVYKVTVTYQALAAAQLTADSVIAVIPAKMRVVSVIADTTIPYSGGAVATVTLVVGKTTGGAEYIASHDVKTATVVKGLADVDLGTALVRSAAVQGGDLPSWSGSTNLSVRITTTGANTNALTAGSTTYYITTASMP